MAIIFKNSLNSIEQFFSSELNPLTSSATSLPEQVKVKVVKGCQLIVVETCKSKNSELIVVDEALTCQGTTCSPDSQLDLIQCDHSILSLKEMDLQLFSFFVFHHGKLFNEFGSPKSQD